MMKGGIQALMKQAQEMQQKMTAMQEEIAGREYEGVAGGKLVTVLITGKGEMKKLSIDDSLFADNDKEMLEDLIVAAFNDAKHRADSDASDGMSSLTSGMSLPPGMKLPF